MRFRLRCDAIAIPALSKEKLYLSSYKNFHLQQLKMTKALTLLLKDKTIGK